MAFSKVTLNGDTLMDVTQKTVTAASMLSGVTALKNDGTDVTGSIASKSSSDLTASGATVTVPAGYYSVQATKSVASGSATTPATTINSYATISVNSETGTITATNNTTKSVTPTVSAGYVSSGTAGTISVKGSNNYNMSVQGAQTVYPSTVDQTIASGKYLTGTQTFKAVAIQNLTAENIAEGVTVKIGDSDDDDRVLSVTGTHSGGDSGNVKVKEVGSLSGDYVSNAVTSFSMTKALPTSFEEFRLYGRCFQNGTPAIATPVEIQRPAATTIGKNRLEIGFKESVTASGITATPIENNGILINGTATENVVVVPNLAIDSTLSTQNDEVKRFPSANYTVSDLPDGVSIQLVNTNSAGTDSITTLTLNNSNKSGDFANRNYSWARLYIASGYSYKNVAIYPVVRINSPREDNDWMPYKETIRLSNSGKNLLPHENGDQVLGGSTGSHVEVTVRDDGGLNVVGTVITDGIVSYPFYKSYYVLNMPRGTYHYKLLGSGTGFSNLNLQIYSDTGSGNTSTWVGTDDTKTIGSSVIGNYMRLRIPAGDYDCVVYPMMLLPDADATEFEAFSGNLVEIPVKNGLCGFPVSSGGNVEDTSGNKWIADYLSLAENKYVRRIRTVILDGQYSGYTVVATTDPSIYRLNITNGYPAQTDGLSTTIKQIMCDRLEGVTASSISGTYGAYAGVSVDADGLVHVCLGSGVSATTKEDFQTWFASNPTTVMYILAEPIETDLTTAQAAGLASMVLHKGNSAVYSYDLVNPLMYARYYRLDDSAEAGPKDVNFIDYDGTILYSYTKAEFAQLTALPANPDHSGDDIPLTSQGWNWTLANAKTRAASGQIIWIGQTYTTTDEKTHIGIKLSKDRLSPYLGVAVNGTISISWGDNSANSTLTGTSLTSQVRAQHIYASDGEYVITISVITGSFAFYSSGVTTTLLNKNDPPNALQNVTYTTAVKWVRIGSNVSIGINAFYNCYGLSTITIPNSVTVTSGNMFYNCYSLASITLPSAASFNGSNSCYGCCSLAYASLPDTVSIPAYVFRGCSSLKSITIPNGTTTIMEYSFYNDYGLSSVVIPNSVTTINSSAFYNCYALSAIVILSGVTTIGSSAFRACYSLSSITIPSTVTSIATKAFYDCYGLAKIRFESGTPPTVSNSDAFTNIPPDCVISVPTGKLSAYTSASNYPSSSTYTYIEE